jgi:hypothetical protein
MTDHTDNTREDRSFGRIHLRGGRYEQAGLPLSTAVELERYQKLVSAVAHHLYMQEHPRRKRAPRGFNELLDLRLVDVEAGSVIPVLARTNVEAQPALLPVDWHERARTLINEAFASINEDRPLPKTFPAAALKELASFGRSLREGESIELSGGNARVAEVTLDTRRRVQVIANLEEIEVELTVQGQITGLRSDPQRLDVVLADLSRRKLVAQYVDQSMWSELREFEGFAERAPLVSLSVVARQALDGEIRAIVDVLGVEAALPPDWAARIAEIAGLRRGWLYPESETPTRDALDASEEFLLACVDDGLPRPSIYPSSEGGVQFEWRRNSVTVEVEVLNTGEVKAYAFDVVGDNDSEHSWREFDTDELLAFVAEGLRG